MIQIAKDILESLVLNEFIIFAKNNININVNNELIPKRAQAKKEIVPSSFSCEIRSLNVEYLLSLATMANDNDNNSDNNDLIIFEEWFLLNMKEKNKYFRFCVEIKEYYLLFDDNNFKVNNEVKMSKAELIINKYLMQTDNNLDTYLKINSNTTSTIIQQYYQHIEDNTNLKRNLFDSCYKVMYISHCILNVYTCVHVCRVVCNVQIPKK